MGVIVAGSPSILGTEMEGRGEALGSSAPCGQHDRLVRQHYRKSVFPRGVVFFFFFLFLGIQLGSSLQGVSQFVKAFGKRCGDLHVAERQDRQVALMPFYQPTRKEVSE